MTTTFNAALALATARTALPAQIDPNLPTCPVCHAPAIAGYLHRAWNDLAHDCNCVLECEQAYLNGLRRLWQQMNAHPHYLATLPERYQGYDLNSLTQTPQNAAALRAVRAGLTGNLYLFGPAGTGKTHLAAATAAHLAQQGLTARFWGMAALFAALRDSFASGAARPELMHWDVLVLDDIDKLKPTAYVYETFYALVEERWSRRKITIFTAQLDADRAARVLTPEGNQLAADPLASRMASGLVAKIDGQDQRFKSDGAGL